MLRSNTTRYRYSLAGLLLVMTTIAVICAMIRQWGYEGFLRGLFVISLLYLGGGCIYASLRYKPHGWISGLIFGLMLVGIAALFATIDIHAWLRLHEQIP